MTELTTKQRFWKQHVDALATYEGSAVDYAREHDLNPKTLYAFKAAIAKREQRAGNTSFATVSIADVVPTSAAGATITLPNRVTLTVTNLDAPGLLERLAHL